MLWKDAGCVNSTLKGVKMPVSEEAAIGPTGLDSELVYNEYICYDIDQVRLRYLFRVNML